MILERTNGDFNFLILLSVSLQVVSGILPPVQVMLCRPINHVRMVCLNTIGDFG